LERNAFPMIQDDLLKKQGVIVFETEDLYIVEIQ